MDEQTVPQDKPAEPSDQPGKPWFLCLPPHGAGVNAPAGGGAAPPGAGLPADTMGLALSGGGIRSATFCLGVLQTLARQNWLPSVDYLSTVSGGGYVGAFLGRFFDLCAKPGGVAGAIPDSTPGAAQKRVARDLSDSRSAPVSWLRRHANYLSPTGLGEAVANVVAFWRSLIAIYLVLGLFLFATFGLVNALGYANLRGRAPAVADFVVALAPMSGHLPPWGGPWGVLAELGFWLAVVPQMIAYWLVSQDRPEAFIPPVLATAAILAVALLIASAHPLSLVLLAAAVFWTLAAWAQVLRQEGHNDPFNPARLLFSRNLLTRWLAFWAGFVLILAAFAVVDWVGRRLAVLMLEGGLSVDNLARWFTTVATTVLGLATALRMVVHVLSQRGTRRTSTLLFARPYLVAALLLVVGALPPLIALSFASHAAYEAGEAYGQGLAATAVAVVVSLLLGARQCVPFINRSSPLVIYAGRLARTFLGAVNPARRTHPEGGNVDYVVPGDDVPYYQYLPHAAGGPLHLINCGVNETIDVASQRTQRDRQAENFAIGPAGISVAQRWHALWDERPAGPPRLAAVAPDGGPHPFLSTTGGPVAVESLDLREWVATSGAALGPGMGRNTGPGRALLLTLANARLGYWWNSGLNVTSRQDVPVQRGLRHVLGTLLSLVFRAQSLLLSELVGRFPGPWYRYWYLSDGANFEVTGAYELLRRRVPFVVVCDAAQDTAQKGEVLALLVLLARVDLGAEIVAVDGDRQALAQLGVPTGVADHLGTPQDLLAPPGGLAPRHACLLSVHYPPVERPSADPWLNRNHTWLLYLKATLVGDEPADVRSYAGLHPDFPNETTLNQFFDEPQWESYRKLGEHIGAKLFVAPPAAGVTPAAPVAAQS
jgi:hypothetical protein